MNKNKKVVIAGAVNYRDVIVVVLAWGAYFFIFKDDAGSFAKGLIIWVSVCYPFFIAFRALYALRKIPSGEPGE